MTESKPPAVRSVTIEGFRGVRSGFVGELSPLSVLVGPNNCGKSTVLEAIAVSASDARTLRHELVEDLRA